MIDDGRMGDAMRIMADAFGDGPFRDFMEETGRVVLRKLEERGLAGTDPSELDPVLAEQLLRSAWIEAAITSFPGADEATIIADIDRWFDQMMMDKLSNADGPETAQ